MTTQTKVILVVSVLAVGALGTFFAIQSAKKSVPPTNTVTETTTSKEHGGVLGFLKGMHISLVGA